MTLEQFDALREWITAAAYQAAQSVAAKGIIDFLPSPVLQHAEERAFRAFVDQGDDE